MAFKAFLQSSEQLKYFFVVILWDKLFKNTNYEFMAFRALEFVQRTTYYKDIFTNWL